jgi:hypothetical protein
VNEQDAHHEPRTDVFHLRQDVVKALRERPPTSFEDLYDKLKTYDAEYALQLLADAEKYSHDINTKQAFAAGVLHVLNIQIASYEVGLLETQFGETSDGGVDEGLPPSGVPDGDQPAA